MGFGKIALKRCGLNAVDRKHRHKERMSAKRVAISRYHQTAFVLYAVGYRYQIARDLALAIRRRQTRRLRLAITGYAGLSGFCCRRLGHGPPRRGSGNASATALLCREPMPRRAPSPRTNIAV